MTDKQKTNVETALKLFAKNGYDAVATRTIAREANVSEGLIFRHFESKQGLLNAIIELGKEHVDEQVQVFNTESDPGNLVRCVLEWPFQIPGNEYNLWRLLFSLKWKSQNQIDSLMLPIHDLVLNACEEMKYEDPEIEAHLIMSYIDGFMMAVLLKSDHVDIENMLKALRAKYIKPV